MPTLLSCVPVNPTALVMVPHNDTIVCAEEQIIFNANPRNDGFGDMILTPGIGEPSTSVIFPETCCCCFSLALFSLIKIVLLLVITTSTAPPDKAKFSKWS